MARLRLPGADTKLEAFSLASFRCTLSSGSGNVDIDTPLVTTTQVSRLGVANNTERLHSLAEVVEVDYPKISCIMPTRNRRQFIAQALKLFLDQDYPNRELLVIDDGTDKIGDLIPDVPHIRYVAISEPLTIGTKRNIACALATGDVIVAHDDDDYYGPNRLTRQVAPLLRGEAECSAMRMSLLLDANAGTLWTPSDDTHRQCFKQDIHYGTLLFRASYWRQGTHFASVNVGEDRRFVHALLAQDARLSQIVDPASFAYVLHGGNTTSDMRLVHPDGWTQVAMEQYLGADEQAFYQSLSRERV